MSRRFVAFLKGINVGGHTVSNDTLRAVFAKTGLTDVEPFLASGNLVFASATRSVPALERKLEARLSDALGFEAPTFIRSADEVAAVAADPLFPSGPVSKTAGRYVGFLAAAPGPPAARAVRALRSPNDHLEIRGREVYWLSRAGMSGSRISYVAIERALGQQATFRSLNTLTRLVAKFSLDV